MLNSACDLGYRQKDELKEARLNLCHRFVTEAMLSTRRFGGIARLVIRGQIYLNRDLMDLR